MFSQGCSGVFGSFCVGFCELGREQHQAPKMRDVVNNKNAWPVWTWGIPYTTKHCFSKMILLYMILYEKLTEHGDSSSFVFWPLSLWQFSSGQSVGISKPVMEPQACSCRLCGGYTYMHTCIHAYMHTCIHACMHACIHAYMHTCIHAYMHTCIHAYMHTCIHAYMHTCIHTYIHICIHAYICVDIYIITYLYIFIKPFVDSWVIFCWFLRYVCY